MKSLLALCRANSHRRQTPVSQSQRTPFLFGSRFWFPLPVHTYAILVLEFLPFSAFRQRMDDSADPCWSWPYWKFGLKRDDLFGTLHDQYNTVPSPILDPEAFHHDVYEISQQAGTTDEFHRLLQERKEQRLRELNETLESAAFEIIANPTLIGTEQWQHAVQLFRTRSLDSLLRYFASYLPSDHPWYKSTDSATTSDAGSSVGSLTESHGSLFDDDESIMTEEPSEYLSYPKQLLPPSPRSMTMCSDSSVASPIDEDVHHHFDDFGTATPARTLSFSESEPDCCAMPHSNGCCGCEDISRSTDSQPAVAPTSGTYAGGVDHSGSATTRVESRPKNATHLYLTSSSTDFDTPTPRPEAYSTSFFDDTKDTAPATPHRRCRSLSPSRPQPLSEREVGQLLIAHRDPRNPQRSRCIRKERESSPAVERTRRSPVDSTKTIPKKIQKPLPEATRLRTRSRRGFVDS
ncbi:uncharacterized protein B0T15DRAFT_506218 [Chaetomium strumarium]|uniref:Uncharacterized protein n=1 Tax=Chaetomium strumarium TaxID=1170767 RepID=A0AAJ0H0T4_9PEZI|nr:hypothetical protein B0T15DRAFT_506218 [Chaetomium strumarium]